MRAFKKLMAGAIATAIAATMATSAFAASFDAGKVGFAIKDAEGNVTGYDYTAAGQTTVLVVPADVWTGTAIADGLEDSDILYINQYEDADEANDAIVAGFGVKLDETGTLPVGNYYALFGGTTEDGFAITPVAFEVKAAEPEEPDTPATKTIQLGECDGIDGIDTGDYFAILKHIARIPELTGDYLIAADCDGIEGIDTGDAFAILKHIAKLLELGTVTVNN